MALTKVQTPENFSQVGNPIIFSASYPTPSEAGFKWIADVYVAGTKIARLKKQPTYAGSQFFDVSNILQNSLSYDFNPQIKVITKSATNSLKNLRVDLGYSTTAAGDVISADSGQYWIYNGYQDRNANLTYQDADYLPNYTTSTQGITAWSYQGVIPDATMSFFQTGSSAHLSATTEVTISNCAFSGLNGTHKVIGVRVFTPTLYIVDIDYPYTNEYQGTATIATFYNSTDKNFLTNFSTRNVKKSDYGTLSLLHGQVTPYWSVWAQIGIVTNDDELFLYLVNPFNGDTIDEQRLDVPIYPQNLNDALAAGNVLYWNGITTAVLTGVTNLFETFTYTKYGSPQTLTGGITQYKASTLYVGLKTSKYYTFNIVDDCSKNDTYQISWLNSLGAFDFISFNGTSSEELSWKRSEYKKRLGNISTSTSRWSYTGKDFEVSTFNTVESKEFTVNTNWLDDSESARVIEMLGSPVVYINSNDEWIPCNVTVDTQLKQTKNNQKLINYTLTFKPSYNQRKQKF